MVVLDSKQAVKYHCPVRGYAFLALGSEKTYPLTYAVYCTGRRLFLTTLTGSDLFQVLKKRHACRRFDSRPIPDEILEKIIYAAHRAPTAGNVPYRFLIVVKNPMQLKMIKAVSQGYFGDSPAAIVICTNLKARQELGKVDVEECARYDAGAAAENMALASYELGLGSAFVKSYSENALRAILELPLECRTELIVSLGYPARDEAPPLKKRKEHKITYIDRYGCETSSTVSGRLGTDSTTPEQYLFELALFFLTAAQESITEPHTYSTLRLLDAVSHVADLYSKTNLLKPDQFLIEAKKEIDANKNRAVFASDKEFANFIEELIGRFADELRRRYSTADMG